MRGNFSSCDLFHCYRSGGIFSSKGMRRQWNKTILSHTKFALCNVVKHLRCSLGFVFGVWGSKRRHSSCRNVTPGVTRKKWKGNWQENNGHYVFGVCCWKIVGLVKLFSLFLYFFDWVLYNTHWFCKLYFKLVLCQICIRLAAPDLTLYYTEISKACKAFLESRK